MQHHEEASADFGLAESPVPQEEPKSPSADGESTTEAVDETAAKLAAMEVDKGGDGAMDVDGDKKPAADGGEDEKDGGGGGS